MVPPDLSGLLGLDFEMAFHFGLSDEDTILLRIFLLLLELTEVDVADGLAWLGVRHVAI